MADIEETIIGIGKDVLISLIILSIILGSLYAFSGRWPPMVVIESGSMMHSQESQIGVIDPGDIVIVQESDKEDITTYVEGRASGYRKYGQYGDVIIFEPDGDRQETPIIHRAVLYLEENASAEGTFDIPSLQDLEHGTDWDSEDGTYYGIDGKITLYNYGHQDDDLEIDLSELSHGGYITRGDNNDEIDQTSTRQLSPPVKEEWIKGRATGELPWFGIIKLAYIGRTEHIPRNSWNNFAISLAIILLLPMIVEIGSKIHSEMTGGYEKEIDKNSSKDIGQKQDVDKGKSPQIESRNGRDLNSDRGQEREE
ncbi:MAG: S26 family signal peptidase [Candidatus Natronoplasma sp.]